MSVLRGIRSWFTRSVAPTEPSTTEQRAEPGETARGPHPEARDDDREALTEARRRARREEKRADAAVREQKRLEERVRVLTEAAARPRPADPTRVAVAPVAPTAKRKQERDARREEKQKAREALIAKLEAKVTALEVNARVLRTELEAARKAAADTKTATEAKAARRAEAARADDLDGDHALEVHFSPGEACLEAILRCIHETEDTLDVCVFTITDDRIADALLAAHRRKVRVRIISDNDKANDEGSDVWRLERAGLPVCVDRTDYHMHHKFAVFDGRVALTGSYNWTRGAARNNEENLVIGADPRLVRAFTKEFDALWRQLGGEAS